MGIKWDSPWGKGRPGWHTECVVMIQDEFHGMIDIHGGGMDLKFPHHENEVAQNEALHHNSIANYWIHNAMINIDGIKMSKSLGNVTWAKDAIEKLGAPLVRWLMNSVSYRKELNFSDDTIAAAKKELDKVFNALKQAEIKYQLANITNDGHEDSTSIRKFLDEMDDDLNTPNAYTVIFDTVKQLNNSLRQREIDFNNVIGLTNSILAMLDVLGVEYKHINLTNEDIDDFNKWNDAKKEKDFALADTYRQKLIDKGLL